ncbi:PHP domain-containing protein [Halorubellus sp. JP-L1]|uniref:PHP domain-containing protein n=1 Tax=Halorubellus sp. JP-L1 TaxID=2715753 RepID=UPI001409A6E0|nr:PHP domain-containing protein [Halorubellus sp. JP-L1]NHN42403.1 PHP domain-containing protein [Halorubellus sp. JP-L1]
MGSDEFRVDAHVKVLSDAVVERAKRRGVDALVYAPHFEQLPDVREAAARYSDDELLVVPGREVFTGTWRNRRHVLAIGLSEPVPDFITLEGAMAEFDRQDATVLVPHPTFLNVSLGYEEIQRYRDQIAAVEAYNPKLLGGWADRAKRLVADFDVAPFGSSYAHVPGSVGEVWTAFDGEIQTPADVVDAFESDDARRVGRRSSLSHRFWKAVEFSHLGFENTWAKVDRTFLQGTEPTHPRHLLYGSRFDDVAVYE